MGESEEIRILDRVCREAKATGYLTEPHLATLSAAFGSRFTKAQAALGEKRIKKYTFNPSGRIIWIVVGREREYLIMPLAIFCSCDDFYFRVMDKEVQLCYHLIAQKLAQTLSVYDSFEEEDNLYDSLIKDWKKSSLK